MIDASKKESDEKMKTYDSKLDNITAMMENIMDKIQISNYSQENMDSPKFHYLTTAVPDNKKAQTF